jgi:hypothetical protein
MSRYRRGLLALILPALAVAAAVVPVADAAAQDREIISHQVTVSSAEAAILLEFTDGGELSVSFRDQRVLLDGEEVGRYQAGGALDSEWRAFLGRAVAADGEVLTGLLRDWTAPAGLEADDAAAASVLESRMQGAVVAAPPAQEPPQVIHPEGDVQELVERLILRTDRLRALAAVAEELGTEDLRVHVGEEVVVEEGEVVASSLLVLDGDLTLDGRVDGDVILLGGRVSLGEAARVGGDLRWIDADVSGNRAAVAGTIREVQPVADRPAQALRDEIREEIRQAMGAAAAPDRRVRRAPALTNIARGVGSVFQTLVTFAILFGIGLLLLYFAPRNFEVAARTARYATGRAALVGLAGSLLAFPLWVVGIVVLAVTVIGIPVMLLWLPLFPAAVALAITFGYLAVARNLGRWASQRHIHLESLDASRPAVQLGAGLVVLLAAFALAGVFQMGGAWLSLFQGLITFVGVMLTIFAGLVGFGAILLSRGGRDPLYAGPGWSWAGETDPWASESDPFHAPRGPEPPPPPGTPPHGGAAPAGGPGPTDEPGRDPAEPPRREPDEPGPEEDRGGDPPADPHRTQGDE